MPFPVKPPSVFLSCLPCRRSPMGDEWPFWHFVGVRRFWIAGASLCPFFAVQARPANRPQLSCSKAGPSPTGQAFPLLRSLRGPSSSLPWRDLQLPRPRSGVTVYSGAGCTRRAVGLSSCSCFLHWVLCPGTEQLPRRVPWALPGPPQLACFSLLPAPTI